MIIGFWERPKIHRKGNEGGERMVKFPKIKLPKIKLPKRVKKGEEKKKG